jgi:hypothetical protein
MKVKKNYVDNKKLYAAIVEYKEKVRLAEANGDIKPRISEYIGNCIRLIAENVAKRYYKFARYSYVDEMVGDAIINCIKYFDNFDETKYSNPHAYFTQICYQANVQRIKIEKRGQYIKYKTLEEEFILNGDPDIIFHEKTGLLQKEIYDNMSTYIENFERSEEEKKLERKKKVNDKKMKDSLDRFLED